MISTDYAFMGQDDGKTMPILISKDRASKTIWATVVPSKGVDDFAITHLLSVFTDSGYKRFTHHSDNEPAILALKREASRKSGLEVLPRESPVEDHQANGDVENAIRELKRQTRALKFEVEESTGKKLGDKDHMLSWIPRHAAFLLSKYRVGEDGKTCEQRRTGRAWRRPALTFGERILFKPVQSGNRKKNDFQVRMIEGHYVGTSMRSAELLVMTVDGVKRGGAFQRLNLEERWKTPDWDSLKGLPWDMAPPARVPMQKPISIETPTGLNLPAPVIVVQPEARKLYIVQKNLDDYGYTANCPGCEDVISGRIPKRVHNGECRSRIETELSKTSRGRLRIGRNALKRARDTATEVVADPGSSSGNQDAVSPAPGVQQPGQEAVSPAPGPGSTQDAVSPAPGGSASTAQARDAVSPAPASVREEDDLDMDPADMQEDVVLPDMVDAPPASSKRPPDNTAEQAQAQEKANGEDSNVMVGSLSPAKMERIRELKMVLQKQHEKEGVEICSLDLTAMAVGMMALGNEHQLQPTERPDVAEVFSPPRFTAEASRFGLRPGFAVDCECVRRDGQRWDLSKPSDRAKLKQMQERVQPYVLTGGPPCDAFSPLQALNNPRRTAEQNAEVMRRGRMHLRTAIDAYKRQIAGGRYFLHEHPAKAKSWLEDEVKELESMPGVFKVQGPMCRFDMMAEDGQGMGFARKETRYLTNSPRLAAALEGVCSNFDASRPWHRHVQLINGRATMAKVYPPKMVVAVLEAIRQQLIDDGMLNELSSMMAGPVPEHQLEEDWGEDGQEFLDGDFEDDVNGGVLDQKMAMAARAEELEWLRRRQTWTKVPLATCFEKTGQKPISLRWVDTNKGDDERPDYRSRLVVREIRKGKNRVLPDAQLFSSMPPLEALKTMCSLCMTGSKRRKMQSFDIRRAHLYGKPQREIFTDLPEEEAEPGFCARLNYCLYGTQDAAVCWEREYVSMLVENGFEQGISSPTVFLHRGRDLRVLVHGDDFFALGDDAALDFLEKCIAARYDYKKSGRLGTGRTDVREVGILNRHIRLCTGPDGEEYVEYEADPRHAQIVIRGLGLETAKSNTTPRNRLKNDELDQYLSMPALGPDETRQYRSLVMRAAYLSQDRPDISEAVKALSRKMKEPNLRDGQDLKRLGRYLKGRPRAYLEFRRQDEGKLITVAVDTDHAGCLVTRKSTTGMAVFLGSHLIRHGSNMQTTIALSSGESEYYGLVKGCAAGLGQQSLLRDWATSLRSL